MKLARLFLSALAVFVVAIALAQSDVRPTATFTLDKSSVQAGATLTGKVTISFADGYHAYQNPPSDEFEIPLKIAASKGGLFKVLKVSYPKGEKMAIAGSDKPSAVYTNVVVVPVTLKAPTKLGAQKVLIEVDYQQCNATACLPPDTINLASKVTVKAAKKKS